METGKVYHVTTKSIAGYVIFNNEVASVILEPKHPIVVEKQSDIPKLGRVILRKKGRVIAAAIVEDVMD